MSAEHNSVGTSSKTANVSAHFKKDDETDKQIYRPISLLCVPGKLMEHAVATLIATHISEHNLGHPHQWAYKKCHSTELLLTKMIEDWKRALDNNLVVGIAFVDFRKAFDFIPHHVLVEKLRGVAGNLLCWIKNLLADCTQVTVENGIQSETLPVKFGVPQGSVLGHTLFSLFCRNLPDIAGVRQSKIHMYADDTTIYVAESSPDKVVIVLNSVLQKLYEWCCHNHLIYPSAVKQSV
ncbi:RNA-directed DNA polymerase from mobile element jockey [Acropora cervicornis]|uniref:RNA-directed DNA polymerase from mobile element jockey n=1 Tax=Acropora cervicornis TaxID=6130 RepID=A0AAD9QIB2_ACRCE|nr:RNA-directed DNA polymerase from mobile element jockey [Acropora cervicornis]